MSDKKIEKALYGPSTFEVALGAVLGIVCGVALACAYLIWKPVQAVKEWPKEPVPGVVYHLAGRADPGKAKGWQGKLTALAAGGTIAANENELNLWAASLHAPAAGKPAEPAPGPASEFLSASGLNFRLEADAMHVSQKVRFNYFGVAKEVLMQAKGGFRQSGDGFFYAPDEVYLGSCPLHHLPGAAGLLTKALLARQRVPDDFRAVWAKVSNAAVEDSLLTVTTRP